MQVNISVIATVASSFGMAVILLAAGAVGGGVILLVVSLFLAVLFWFIRGQLKLCAR